jgi:NAD(P)H-dependent flavin oxidoreductase YrpB (nitropropane dioxygenase family)
MVQLGCDMVTVQGGEGGGHTGAVPTTVLLPQVLDAVKCAGGGRRRALATGAGWRRRWPMARRHRDGHALPDDGGKPGSGRAQGGLRQGRDRDIVVSTKVDGIPQRMILNPLLRRIEGSASSRCGLRAMEAGLEMKRQTGMSWGEVLRTAKA